MGLRLCPRPCLEPPLLVCGLLPFGDGQLPTEEDAPWHSRFEPRESSAKDDEHRASMGVPCSVVLQFYALYTL